MTTRNFKSILCGILCAALVLLSFTGCGIFYKIAGNPAEEATAEETTMSVDANMDVNAEINIP